MKIAIIGSGISGLGAAYLLAPRHEITVYEKNNYVGGHCRTVEVKTPRGTVPVDTGFIVFNKKNYPHLSSMLRHLNVPVTKSDMSFGVSIENGWLEYGTQKLFNIFAQKRNLLRPAFWRMLRDILRFNQQAHIYLEKDSTITLATCLDELGMGRWFRQYYLLAMGGAIWSMKLSQMLDFPAKTFIRFFDNHGLLTVNDRPQWYTVVGGSKEYVKRLTASFQERIQLNCGVHMITRGANDVTVTDVHGKSTQYDQVILACHSDQALAMLDNPTADETSIIGSIRYQPNRALLHSDERFMPQHKKAWASWVYLSDVQHNNSSAMSLSYWMNHLQPLNTKTAMIVTLNPHKEPDMAAIHDEYRFEHPVLDQAAIDAQTRMDEIQGKDRIWFCGAWLRYGFHEDGLLSAVNVATALGAEVPWK